MNLKVVLRSKTVIPRPCSGLSRPPAERLRRAFPAGWGRALPRGLSRGRTTRPEAHMWVVPSGPGPPGEGERIFLLLAQLLPGAA